MKSRSRVLWIGLVLVVWGIAQWFIWRAMEAADARYLIITADDAGLCPAVNEATVQALEFGLVKSTSIMSVCPGFDEFADYAVAHPAYDYGVHLVLTSENPDFSWGPILGASVPSLVRADGAFWRKSEEVAEHADAGEVAQELEAQVRRVLDRGITVTHLDHHMWVLLQRPDLFEVFVKLGLEFNVPLRIHRDFIKEECGGALQDANEYQRIIKPLVDRKDVLIDFIETNNYLVAPQNKSVHFTNALRTLPPGISEFVIHCSVNRPGMAMPSGVDRRAADLKVFTSREIRDEIRQLGIRVVDWKELVELRKRGTI